MGLGRFLIQFSSYLTEIYGIDATTQRLLRFDKFSWQRLDTQIFLTPILCIQRGKKKTHKNL
jgi:hypothetical protein